MEFKIGKVYWYELEYFSNKGLVKIRIPVQCVHVNEDSLVIKYLDPTNGNVQIHIVQKCFIFSEPIYN